MNQFVALLSPANKEVLIITDFKNEYIIAQCIHTSVVPEGARGAVDGGWGTLGAVLALWARPIERPAWIWVDRHRAGGSTVTVLTSRTQAWNIRHGYSS